MMNLALVIHPGDTAAIPITPEGLRFPFQSIL